MKLTEFYAYTEQTFDSFRKQVIRNEHTDALRGLTHKLNAKPCFRPSHPLKWRDCPLLTRSPKNRWSSISADTL